jgi:hypothetical protein
MVWSALFQIGVSLGLLWRVVGVSTLGGLAGSLPPRSFAVGW